jgi:malate dehydrogenase (oxaloacetate-decarboxylating)(NADP+)
LAAQVSEENFEKGLIFPPFTNIRKISAHIAAKVAAKAYELGELLTFPFRKLSQNSFTNTYTSR